MAGRWGRTSAMAIGCAIAAGADRDMAGAQDASAFSITGTVSSSIEVDDNRALNQNPSGTDTRFVTQLGIDVKSQTPTSTLTLSFGADLQLEDRASVREENGIEKPYVRFRYDLEGSTSLLTLDGSYRTDDLDSSFFFDTDGDLLEDTLLSTIGQVENTEANLTYQFGIDAPLGGRLHLGRVERDYSDTVDPGQFDTTTDTADLTLSFQIAPVATARIVGSWQDYEAEDTPTTMRETTSLGVGLNYEIGPDLVFDGEISQTDFEVTRTVGTSRVTTETSGIAFDLDLTRELANGTAGIGVSRIEGTLTHRTDLTVSRALETPGADIEFSIGVSDSNTGDLAVIGSLDYLRELPMGELKASLSREAAVNIDDEEVLRTLAQVSYDHELTPISGIGVTVRYARTDDIGLGSVIESSRGDLEFSYRRSLTENWDWTVGYQGRFSRSASSSTATSNRVFATVSRGFSIRP